MLMLLFLVGRNIELCNCLKDEEVDLETDCGDIKTTPGNADLVNGDCDLKLFMILLETLLLLLLLILLLLPLHMQLSILFVAFTTLIGDVVELMMGRTVIETNK